MVAEFEGDCRLKEFNDMYNSLFFGVSIKQLFGSDLWDNGLHSGLFHVTSNKSKRLVGRETEREDL